MEQQDDLDRILYRCLPALDRAMLQCLESGQKEAFKPSRRFERRMERLIKKEAASRKKALSRERLPVLAFIILAALLMALPAAGAMLYRVYIVYYRDQVQGADVYQFHSERTGDREAVKIYPSYIPEGYELAEEEYRETARMLKLRWLKGEEYISYTMNQIADGSGASFYIDSDYDSEETVTINDVDWFLTYRKDVYRMARLQTGDLFFLIRTPDTLPREELIRILEGISLPEGDDIIRVMESAEEGEIDD